MEHYNRPMIYFMILENLTKPLYVLVVGLLRRSMLFISFLGRYLEALGWPMIAVPSPCIASAKVITAIVAEVDREWVYF